MTMEKNQAFFNRRYIFIPWLVFPAIAMVIFFQGGVAQTSGPKVAWLSFLSIAGNGWPPKTGVPWGYPVAVDAGPGVVGDGWMFWEAGWRWLEMVDFWRWLIFLEVVGRQTIAPWNPDDELYIIYISQESLK